MFPFRSPAPYLPNNTVRLIRGGNAYFEILDKLIQEAAYTIHIQVYIFDEDETGKRVAEALIKAARRNVKVFVLVDGYASQNISAGFIQTLRTEGIYFRRFEPLLKSKKLYFGRRLHHKLVVVDAARSLVAGLNISNRYNDMPKAEAWLDWAIYVEGSISASLNAICNRRTRNRGFMKKKLPEPKKHPVAVAKGPALVRVRINDWVNRHNQISNSYREMFRHASSHIIIMTPYFMPGYDFRRLMRLAGKRGVKIQIILAGISDVSFSKYAERFSYRWLFKNKIEIYEYQRQVLHGKMAICDSEWLTVGSYNLNDLSAYASVELNLDVANKDFVMKAEQTLQELITNDCTRITEQVFAYRTTFVQRILQRGAYTLTRFLLFLFTFTLRQRN
jgi:cardiolipin synthase A/B